MSPISKPIKDGNQVDKNIPQPNGRITPENTRIEDEPIPLCNYHLIQSSTRNDPRGDLP